MKKVKYEQYMREVFKLALKGLGHTSPNPLVGAIVVKDDIIIGSGYHEKYGGAHAEVNAINSCIESLDGSTIYCNLEPCCHYNKQTPPCAQMLIKNKVKKVVISTFDPNPEVSGNGVKLLRDAGIEVVTNVLEEEGKKLNEVFFYHIQSKLPFVHIKLAQTLDGKIATASGDSKWISSETARTEVHKLRLKYDAVMVGRKTLSLDDPSLNIRMGVDAKEKIPYKIIVGNLENIDTSLKVFKDGHEDKNIIITRISDYRNTTDKIIDLHNKLGTKIVFLGQSQDEDPIKAAFLKLSQLGITSILLEGGSELITKVIKAKLVNKFSFYICPVLLGDGQSYFNVENITSMKDALRFENSTVRDLDGQAVIDIYPKLGIDMEDKCLQV